MADIVKKVALWGLGLILLSAAGVAVFLVVAGDDFYRWAAEGLLEDALDRKVEIDGSFSLDLGLEPTLVVTDLWIGNATWAEKPEMVRVKHVEVQVALKPLLSGIVQVPRLVVEGLTLDLETGPDGAGNWEIASSEDEKTAVREDLFYPLFEFISLKDVVIAYRDRKSGRDTEILLRSFQKDRPSGDSGFAIQGEGRINQIAFGIKGRFGSLEDALAATAPYPLELTLDTEGMVAKLKGTAENFPHAEGFDMTFTARAASIGQVLKTLGSELELEGRAEASARLKGDLESLSAEDVVFEIVEQSGQVFQVKGSISDLWSATGLDLRFTGKLGPDSLRPMHNLPNGLQAVVNGVARLDVTGRVKGDLEAPAIENLDVQLTHRSGANFSLQGHLSLDLSGDGLTLIGLETTSVLFVPSPALLEQSLGTKLPDMGAIHVTAGLSMKEDWITLSSFKAEAESFGGLRLSAEGRMGKLLKGKLDLDPQLDLSASIKKSRPLVGLFAGFFEEARPSATGSDDDLILLIQQRLRSLGLHPGPADGKLGPHTRAGIETYQAKHGLTVDGEATEEFLHRLQRELEGDHKQATDDDLILMVQQKLNSLGLHPGPVDGKMGPHTRAAIETYQAKHGLTIDGEATAELLHRLQREPGIEGPPAALETDHIKPRTATFEAALPELGPIMASMRLSGREGTYRIDDLRFTIGTKTSLWIEASGALETLRPEQQHPLEGLVLKVAFALPSSKAFSHLIPPDMPELRKITGRFDVGGSPEALSISKARIEAEGPGGLAGVATGQIGSLSLVPGFAMKNLAVELEIQSPSTKDLTQTVGFHLPELGAIRAKATLVDRGDLFAVTGIDASIGPEEKPAVHATGEIGDLLALKQVAVNGSFEVPIARLLSLDIPAEKPSLGEIRGQFDLSDADGSLGLEKLNAEAINTDLFSLSVEGLFDDLLQRDGLNFQVSLEVPDPATLGRRIGFDVGRLGAFFFTGHVSGGDEKFLAEGKAQVGQTEFSGTLSGSIKDTRPVISAKLRSPVFHFADFGLLPEADAEKVDQELEHRLFSGEPIPFGFFKGLDLDLHVLLDQLEGVALDIDKAEAQINLKDGLLKIDPLQFHFVGGSVVAHLVANADAQDPKVSLRLEADDVDLGDLLAQVEIDVPLDGELDMVLDLKAAGASPRALTSSLEGAWDMAISRGHIRTSLLDLAAIDLVHWMVSDSKRKGYSDLNCFILRIDFHEGLGKIERQLLDTTNVLALGKGDINLREETIYIKVDPHAKKTRFIELTTPFSIEGPLSSPSVKVGGVNARMLGEILLAPINLLGSVLLPFVHDRGKDPNNPCLTLEAGNPAG